MPKLSRITAVLSLSLACTSAFSYNNLPIHFLVEGGGYYSTQGKAQRVNIDGLIGDQFNITNRNDTNAIFGAGFLLDGLRKGNFGFDYGINAFYLAKTKVSGTITQELLFTNLAYNYYVSHLPVYLFAKGFYSTDYNHLAITADLGIGPNFMNTNLYDDSSLDGITLPDNAYTGNFSNTVFSGMVGVGVKYTVMNQFPVEIGYRYFYLGEGSFNPRTSAIQNKLHTGNNTAQALLLTISV
jgi:opacity protein-like surface antigen